MNFPERMARARAAHTVTKVARQPGNSYHPEYVCKCGAWVSEADWGQHIIDAADELTHA